jgi:hypothetical protein
LKEKRKMPKSKSAATEAPKKTRKAPSPAPAAGPSYDQIALRAYHIYLERDGAPGDPVQDWLQAERELTQILKKSSRKTKVVSIAA